MSNIFSILLISILLAFIVYITNLLLNANKISAELSRKIVHVAMGLICAAFPYLFSNEWPVYTLGLVSITSLIYLRYNKFGNSLHAVARKSLGELYFPISIMLLWAISTDQRIYYSIAITVLAIADACAALVGRKYGEFNFTTKDGNKTIEGSLVFFFTAFICVHAPLLLLTDTDRANCLLIAITIALIVTMIEAIAWEGLDNLFIPILVFVLLLSYENVNATDLIWRLFLLSFLTILVFLFRKRVTFDDATLIASVLLIYLTVILGSWLWATPPLILFIAHTYLSPITKENSEKVHDIFNFLAVTLPGLIWLILYAQEKNEAYYFYYQFTYVSQLACIAIIRLLHTYSNKNYRYFLWRSTFITLVISILFLPIAAQSFSQFAILVICNFFIAFLSSLLFWLMISKINDNGKNTLRWAYQSMISFFISFAATGVVY